MREESVSIYETEYEPSESDDEEPPLMTEKQIDISVKRGPSTGLVLGKK